MNYSQLILKMIIFTLLLVIGFFASRKNIVGIEFVDASSRLLLDVFIVASILNSVLSGKPDIPKSDLISALLILFLLELLIYLISALISRTVFKHCNNSVQIENLLSVVNALFVGLPIVQQLCGMEGVLYLGLNTIPFFIILYTYGIMRISGNTKLNAIGVLKTLVSPPLIAAVAALLVFLFAIPVPEIISEFCGVLAPVTTPLSLIVIGATIKLETLSSFIKTRNTWLVCFFRLIFIPVIVFLVLSPFISNSNLLITCVIIAATPPGVMCTPLSVRYGYDAGYSSSIITLSTMLSVISIPLLLLILF